MAASETLLIRCGNDNCHARLDVIIPRSRGVSVSLIHRRAEQAGWVLVVVAAQHSASATPILAIDLRCPLCGATLPPTHPVVAGVGTGDSENEH